MCTDTTATNASSVTASGLVRQARCRCGPKIDEPHPAAMDTILLPKSLNDSYEVITPIPRVCEEW